jgi:hypothetical protein
LPLPPLKPALYSLPGGVLSLSGPALLEFLRAVLARGKPFRFQARGFSMHPFIHDGDLLTLYPPNGCSPRLGEVVACCNPQTGKLVVHRVVARRAGGVLLQGDNTLAPDGYIPCANVLGRVTRVARQGCQVRLGLGPERGVIALLARHGLLQPVLNRVHRLLSPFWGR